LEDVYEELLEFARRLKTGELKQLRSDATEARWRVKSQLTGDALQNDLSNTLKYFAGIFYLRGYRDCKNHRERLNAARRIPDRHRQLAQAIGKIVKEDLFLNRSLQEYVESDVSRCTHLEATIIPEICKRLDKMHVEGEFASRNGPREAFGPSGSSWTRSNSAVRQMIRRILQRLRSEERARTRQERFLPRS
jgi:hypothetical protein